MRSYPRVMQKTLDALHSWCEGVEKLREEDRREVAGLQFAAAPARLLYMNPTEVGNVGSGEDDLMSYAIPGGLLSKDGYYLEISGGFTTAANGNNKRVKAKLGSTTIYDLGALAMNDKALNLKCTVIRTGASAQRCMVLMQANDPVLALSSVTFTSATEALASLTTFKFTGEATSDNDIVQKYMTVRWFPANIEATGV